MTRAECPTTIQANRRLRPIMLNWAGVRQESQTDIDRDRLASLHQAEAVVMPRRVSTALALLLYTELNTHIGCIARHVASLNKCWAFQHSTG